jgi:hypothetical protein
MAREWRASGLYRYPHKVPLLAVMSSKWLKSDSFGTFPAHVPWFQSHSYPASQNGYDLTGTITTNGTFGTLDYSTISASYKVSDGLNTFETVSCGAYGVTNLIATATQLLLPANTSMTNPSFTLTGTGFGTPQLTYVYRDWGSGAFSAEHACWVDSQERLNVLWHNAPATTLNGQPWVVATIAPEPASIVTLGIGAIAVLLYMTRNVHRVSKRGHAGTRRRRASGHVSWSTGIVRADLG